MESSRLSLNLRKSINQTLAYASFFDYDLTISELHHWLISPRVVSEKLLTTNYRLLTTNLTRKRLLRRKISRAKINQAQKLSQLLRFIPTIKMIAITGSLAMENAKREDDIDLMVVTQEGTLWLTRLFVIPFVRLFFKSRYPSSIKDQGSSISDAVCLNLWLDETSLTLPRSKLNLYTSHEVLQIKPILNRDFTYERFILGNSWTKKYLANAYKSITKSFLLVSKGLTLKGAKRAPAIGGKGQTLKFVSLLNLAAFRLQFAYMRSKMTSETVSLNSAFFHPRSLAGDLNQHLEKAHNLR